MSEFNTIVYVIRVVLQRSQFHYENFSLFPIFDCNGFTMEMTRLDLDRTFIYLTASKITQLL